MKQTLSPSTVNLQAPASIVSIRTDQNNLHASQPQNIILQTKLSVGEVDDPLEHEADEMADKVMRMPEQNFIQRKSNNDCNNVIQRQGNDETPVKKDDDWSIMQQQLANPDFLKLRAPFLERNVPHLWNPDDALNVYKYNFRFFKTMNLPDDLAAKAANFTAPLAIDAQLKAGNPNLWDISDKELKTSSKIFSAEVFSFDSGFKHWKFLPFLQKKAIDNTTTQNSIQRKCAHCEEEEKAQRKPLISFIQKKENSVNNNIVASDTISNQIQSTKGNGNSLPAPTKNFMESRFGADFSNINIHTDNNATQLSNQLNAQAFTVDNDIYFNEGKYQPESSMGKHLLSHELTHVIQQRKANNQVQKKEFKSTGRANEDTPALINDTVIKSSLLTKYVGADRIKAAFLNSKNFHVIQKYELEEYGNKCKQGDIVDKAGGFFCRSVANAKDKDLAGDIFAVRYLELAYVIHEFMHKLSGVTVKNMLGTFVNEGITQYFTDEFLREGKYDILTDHGYMDNLACANKIVSQTNKQMVADAYFNNNMKLINELQKLLHVKTINDVKPYLDKHQCIP